MQPPLEPHQLATTDEDHRQLLPVQLSRAEAKILYALLVSRNREDKALHGQAHQMHEALLAKLHYYLTEPPPS